MLLRRLNRSQPRRRPSAVHGTFWPSAFYFLRVGTGSFQFLFIITQIWRMIKQMKGARLHEAFPQLSHQQSSLLHPMKLQCFSTSEQALDLDCLSLKEFRIRCPGFHKMQTKSFRCAMLFSSGITLALKLAPYKTLSDHRPLQLHRLRDVGYCQRHL